MNGWFERCLGVFLNPFELWRLRALVLFSALELSHCCANFKKDENTTCCVIVHDYNNIIVHEVNTKYS